MNLFYEFVLNTDLVQKLDAMATPGAIENSLDLVNFKDDLKTAKRDLVLRFVKDQEALQTSLADLKVIDDQTIDIIDATMVVKDEESTRKKSLNHATQQYDSGQRCSHTTDYSPHCGEGTEEGGYEPVLVPRPPSGRPRTSSRSRKKSASDIRGRKSSKDLGHASPEYLRGNAESWHLKSDKSATAIQRQGSSESDTDVAGHGLNSSWPQELMSRKLFASLRTHSVYHPEHNMQEYNVGVVEKSEGMRPKSSHSLKHLPLGAEMVTARISSASDSERVSCNIGPVIRPGSSGRLLAKSQKRKTFINFGLDPNLSFDGPLELEPVHPSEISMFRSGSAASSSRSYALMQLPPIAKEAPTHG